MAHRHSVYDTDAHFKIDPATRAIQSEASAKTTLIQHDHNSERFTFELPRMIDGHDMSLCNAVEIHYLNVEATNKDNANPGLYEVDDLQVSPDSEDVVICSWLISNNATQYVGSLNFVLKFKCIDASGVVDYRWSTGIYTAIAVSKGIDNGEVIVEEYADVLEQWFATLEAYDARITALEQVQDDLTSQVNAKGEEISSAVDVIHQALNATDLGEIVQGSPRTQDGVIYDSDVSICTATPVRLGENTAYNVYCATGWVYTICEYDDVSFANGEKTADKSSAPTFTTQKPYAMLRFNKMVDGVAVAITPDAFNNAVVFCKNESDTKIKNVYAALGIVDFESFIQGAPHPDGHVVESAKSICTSKFLPLGANVTYNVLLSDNWVYSVTEYLDAYGAEGGERTAYLSTSPLFTTKKPYARIRFNKLDENGESVEITPDDFDWSCIFREYGKDNGGVRSDVPENIGVLNAILNAKQCREIKYTPLVNLPAQRGDFPANVEVQGLPYSSTRFDQLYVPNNVSFYTFMSALRNPNSLLYTERLDEAPYNLTNARTYYATVCSIFVEYALGIKPGYVTGIWSQIPGMELIENQSAYGLKLGDVLWQTGHVRLVTDIKRDNRGRIHDIEVMDAWPPVVRVNHYTADTFQSEIMEAGQHKIYRYRYIYKAKHTPTAIVPVEDETIDSEVAYNANIMGRHGDKFNVRVGVDVVLDVLDVASYTQYKVSKDGEVMSTAAIPADNVITLSGLGYGAYSVCLTDGTTDSESIQFIVVDANISAVQTATGEYKVTFNSANATPVYLGWFTNDVNMKHLDVITAEEITAGEKVSTHSTEAYNVWVALETTFGIILSERVRIEV